MLVEGRVRIRLVEDPQEAIDGERPVGGRLPVETTRAQAISLAGRLTRRSDLFAGPLISDPTSCRAADHQTGDVLNKML